MKLAPRMGMTVIDPATSRPLPADGADVEIDSYWVRRLNDGDVSKVQEEKPAPDTFQA